MAAVSVSAIVLALGGLLRGFAQLAAGVVKPLLRAYYDHQCCEAGRRLAEALARGDLDGARDARWRLLWLQEQRGRL